ncbi:hypothetical protein CGCA056_v012976 [Colletotrichum aenigma]|uniref:uncharacterized protein n=1 Tax=Colletotrichum aenigma TaxID=1215731 RepID=UPI001872D585|nr:uncharacterized protein CGCA056_v012976 [Colletotrichum aenigma]KAF5507083.1 hypothetical protein CGCA056_v012976 [Colletotrichum aenigma]
MQITYAFIVSAFAVAAEAVTCASAPFKSGNVFLFSERTGGVQQADFNTGFLRYTPNSDATKAGKLELSNQTQDRKVMCVGEKDAKDWTCFWLDAGGTCDTTLLLDPSKDTSVSYYFHCWRSYYKVAWANINKGWHCIIGASM